MAMTIAFMLTPFTIGSNINGKCATTHVIHRDIDNCVKNVHQIDNVLWRQWLIICGLGQIIYRSEIHFHHHHHRNFFFDVM